MDSVRSGIGAVLTGTGGAPAVPIRIVQFDKNDWPRVGCQRHGGAVCLLITELSTQMSRGHAQVSDELSILRILICYKSPFDVLQAHAGWLSLLFISAR
jgi:hypothetical protein